MDWHLQEIDEVIRGWGSDKEHGLSEEKARERLREFGFNQLEERKKKSPLIKFLEQFKDLVVIILIVASVVSGLLGEWIDSGAIIAIVILNALIGYIQESRAEKALEALKKLTAGGPDYAFECVGVGALAETAYRAIRRGGKAVMVGVAKGSDSTSVRSMTLVFEEKTLTGSYFGSCVPRIDFPKMLHLYMAGKLKLDELITRRYSIDEAPQAFADLQAGVNARGVIVF